MKEVIWTGMDKLSPSELQEVLHALMTYLGVTAYHTDETKQGQKHGIVEVIVEKDQ